MKQRIRVAGLIRNENGVLLFKRSRGRSEAPVFWELPTGKINFGEQPEEAMVRALAEYTGLTATSLRINDVITFMALEDSSQLGNLYIVYDVGINGGIKPIPRDRYTAYKFVKDASGGIQLTEATSNVLDIIGEKNLSSKVSPRATAHAFTINVDGASRGNPGPAGVGYCISNSEGRIIERGGEFIGFATSRVAEYYALKKGVERAIELGYKTARFISDSLMAVNQLNGIFQAKNQDIIPVYQDIQSKLENFDAVSFVHVPRSKNVIADFEANEAIDKILNKN